MKNGLCLSLLVAALSFAQVAEAKYRFEFKNLSPLYTISGEVAECDDSFCRGKVRYELFKTGQKQPFQVFELEDTLLQLNQKQQPLVNQTLGYDEQSGLHIADFNFDGHVDLALCDGTEAGYGMPSYQVYLYTPKSQKFVYSPAFSLLARGEYLGMFEVDRKKKHLIASGKSGCCYHFSRTYQIKNNLPFLVREVIEDGTQGTALLITTAEWVKGKWVKKVKKQPL